jgi:hypothetical protein
MKNKAIISGFILVLVSLSLSGCQDFFGSDGTKRYESHPTKVRYTLSYGYLINCSRTGKYNIDYKCDIPDEIFNIHILSIEFHDDKYEDRILATHNRMKIWDITSTETKNYDLGVTTTIQSESYLISDLTGANALSIQELSDQYPEYVEQYCQAQSNDSIIYIDPNDPNIVAVASNLFSTVAKDNAFLIAKEFFIWLKQQTTYQIHIVNNNAQPASFTLQCRTGDCDDLSFLYMSLCRSVGIPSRFIRGFLIEDNVAIPHVWVEVFVGGGIGDNGWIPIECGGTSSNIESEINQNFGLESAEHLRIFKDDGSDESLNISLAGLTYLTYNSRKIDVTSYAELSNFIVLESNELVIDENGYRQYS